MACSWPPQCPSPGSNIPELQDLDEPCTINPDTRFRVESLQGLGILPEALGELCWCLNMGMCEAKPAFGNPHPKPKAKGLSTYIYIHI